MKQKYRKLVTSVYSKFVYLIDFFDYNYNCRIINSI